MSEPRITVAAFDALSTMAAGALLEPICGSAAWVVAMVATRPHGTLELARTRSDEALAALEWPDIAQALGADPDPDLRDLPADDGSPEADRARLRARRALATAVRRRLGAAFEDVDPPVRAPMWISLDGAENVRDVGGLPTGSGQVVRPGALLRSDSLQQLSAVDVRRLVDDLGVTAVADLRTGVEVDGEGPGPMTFEAGVEVVHLSLFPESGQRTDVAATDDRPAILPWQTRDGEDAGRRSTAEVYLSYLDDRADSVLAALRLIARADGATIVHCAAGKDRTGTVVALALTEVGVEREAIVADYVRSGERIERIFGRLAERPTYAEDTRGKLADADRHRPRATTMEGLLGSIDRERGGVPAWLRAHGWTEDDAQALRAKLLGAAGT